jgi:hypothetical protein
MPLILPNVEKPQAELTKSARRPGLANIIRNATTHPLDAMGGHFFNFRQSLSNDISKLMCPEF